MTKTLNTNIDGQISLDQSAITLQDAYKMLKVWQRHLKLDLWTITISKEKVSKPSHEMEIRIYPTRLKAYIRINETAYKKLTRDNFQKTLLHELVHIPVHAMHREYLYQHAASNPCEELNLERFTDQMEIAVEHFTQIIYSAYCPRSSAE